LSDRSTGNGYKRRSGTQLPDTKKTNTPSETTLVGLLSTAGAAFTCALSLWWATRKLDGRMNKARVLLVLTLLSAVAIALYGFCLRQYRKFAWNNAIETASAMVTNAQALDSATQAASSFIQEVELVSRGYRLSSPLPPASRLDDGKTQTRRCKRLRYALRSALDALITPHIEAYKALQPLSNEANLERYFDMYEITRSDLEDIQEPVSDKLDQTADMESLRMLKVDLHRLFLSRKMFLCGILALDADMRSTTLDLSLVTEIMEDISNKTAVAAKSLDDILGEEERFSLPPTPKSPLTPGRERIQHHIRRFANLSQGLRGLQAKMHILREESDKSLGTSDEVTILGSYLLEQYDAIGADLKHLLTDWEEGRTALTANIGKNERRISLNSVGNILSGPTSPTSLGGLTAVGGSPSDAIKILNGDILPPLDAGSSEEEIFEAMASPRPRGPLNREERIAKMREDRARQASAKERMDASRFMVKELETVIKARPRGRTTGRVPTL
jgi:hypothetical protein